MIPFATLDKGSELTVLENVTGKQVPQGIPLTIGVGETVTVTQALGDTLTLDIGSRLVRIETDDLARLGVEAPKQHGTLDTLSLEDQVWDVLKQSYDPEIPVNIYDLGLIYTIEIDDENAVSIIMTLTAPGCPVAGDMPGWVADAVEPIEGVKQVDVELTWEPVWGMDMMSDEARLELGFM